MARLVIENLDDDTMAKLRRRARRNGRSVDDEVRDILRRAVTSEGATRAPLGSRLAARFARFRLTGDIPELHGTVLDGPKKKRVRRGTLAEFFASSPLRGAGLKVKRLRERPRKPF